jgi:outer membrane usher protein
MLKRHAGKIFSWALFLSCFQAALPESAYAEERPLASSSAEPDGLLETLEKKNSLPENSLYNQALRISRVFFFSILQEMDFKGQFETSKESAAAAKENLRSQLFSRVFGSQAEEQKPSSLGAKVSFGANSLGLIPCLLNAATHSAKFQAKFLLPTLQGEMLPESWQMLHREVDPFGFISEEALQKVGLAAQFDWRKLHLQIDTPLHLKAAKEHHLRYLRKKNYPEEQILKPSELSGYVNSYYSYDVNSGSKPQRRLLLDGALNYRDVVLETQCSYSSLRKDKKWNFGDIRLVHQEPSQLLEYQLGDFSIPTVGFQSSLSVLGLSVTRNFDLDPSQTTYPQSRQSIVLKERSRVEIWVNGLLQRSLTLDPGEHRFQDFPLTEGQNEVELRIVDSFGREEKIAFPFIHEPTLLMEGSSSFSYNIGVPNDRRDQSRAYHHNNPILALFHRKGFSKTFTAGAYLEKNRQQQLLGVEGIKAVPWGLMTFNIGVQGGVKKDASSEFAFENYVQFKNNEQVGVKWKAILSYQGRSMKPFSPDLHIPTGINQKAVGASLNLSKQLTKALNGSIYTDYQIARGKKLSTPNLSNRYYAGLTLSYKTVGGCLTRFDISRDQNFKKEKGMRLLLSFTYNMAKKNQLVSMNHDFKRHTTRAEWHYQSPKSVDAWEQEIAYNRSKGNETIQGSVGYQDERYLASVGHERSKSAPSYSLAQNGRLRLSSALVFAGSHISLSRPINNSFAIIDTGKNDKKYLVGINPQFGAYETKTGRFGAAVKNNLNPYRVNKLSLEVENLPLGYSLVQNSFWMRPTYKSGFFVRAEIQATVFLGALLKDEMGKELPLCGGQIHSEEGDKPITFFTNRSGKVRLPGVKIGKYRIVLFGDRPLEGTFEISTGSSGFIDVGVIQMQGKP